MRENLFLHFLNRDSREIFGLFRWYGDDQHIRLLRKALNAAMILCEDYCIMPPGFVVEDDMAFGLAEAQIDYLAHSLLRFPMRESNIEDYAEKKRSDYYPMRDRYSGLFNDDRLSFLARNASGLIKRTTYISEGIVDGWRSGAEAGGKVWLPVKKLLKPGQIDAIGGIPAILSDEGVALTWSAIAPRLTDTDREASTALRNALQHTYFSQYCREFKLITLASIPYMVEEFYLPRRVKSYNFAILQRYLEAFSLSSMILDGSSSFIRRLRNTRGCVAFMDAFVQIAERADTITNLNMTALRAAEESTFDWSAFGARHRSLLRVPGDVEIAELDHAMQEVSDALTSKHGLSTRMPLSPVRQNAAFKAVIRGNQGKQSEMPSLTLFVALEEELAVLSKALSLTRLAGQPHAAEGKIGETDVAVICPKDMGRVAAAVEVSRYLSSRQDRLPKLLLIVGLAGGFTAEGIAPGHTICAENVVDLAHRKVTDSDDKAAATRFRRKDFEVNHAVRDVLQSHEFDQEAWRRAAEEVGNWPDDQRPSLKYGQLASGDEVIASTDWQAAMLRHTEKLLGVEMEAGGVCAAAKKFGVPVSMLRVVSDSADPAKADDAWRRRGMLTLAELLKLLPLQTVLAIIR